MDAMRPPAHPKDSAIVLQALTPIPDPAFAYPLQVRIDGRSIDGVPWGWSVHPLALGDHTLELWHQSGPILRGSRARVDIRLAPDQPVALVTYESTTMGIRRGRVTAGPYAAPGRTNPA